MNERIICIMLVDDNPLDTFIHERAIKRNNPDNVVVTADSGIAALEYITSEIDPNADLVFLDINMPGMNGWEFLKAYNQLEKNLQRQTIIIMLSTSENPDDIARIKSWDFVHEYVSKPLTKEKMDDIVGKYFASDTL